MEKTVKLGHFIVALLTFLGMGLGAWINVKEGQAVGKVEMANVKEYTKESVQEIRNTMKLNEATQLSRHYELIKAINDLRIIVENKQNRK